MVVSVVWARGQVPSETGQNESEKGLNVRACRLSAMHAESRVVAYRAVRREARKRGGLSRCVEKVGGGL